MLAEIEILVFGCDMLWYVLFVPRSEQVEAQSAEDMLYNSDLNMTLQGTCRLFDVFQDDCFVSD